MTTPQHHRWYCVDNMGMATRCADKADAEDVARTCDIDFPRQAPHRAVQLVELSEMDKLHAKIARLTAENDALRANCKPLTSEQKTAIFQSRAGANDHGVPYLCCYREGFEHIVADIEVAHGIREKT